MMSNNLTVSCGRHHLQQKLEPRREDRETMLQYVRLDITIEWTQLSVRVTSSLK
jgi:hypothetical protein